jgi:putative peptidoglycan lipid II flippase
MAFERHARTVSLLTLVSRVTGLARDATLSRVFGAGGVMDAFFFAFIVPNLFRRLFGEGALAAAFLPAFTRLDRDDPVTARRLASLTVSALVVGLGAVTLAGEAALLVVSHLADHENLAVWLMMIMLPYMPLVCLVAILGAMLQVRGRFGPTAAAPIVLNVCIIGAAIGLGGAVDADTREMHVGGVALAVVVAGLIQVAWSLFALRAQPWWDRDLGAARDEMRGVLRRALPMIVGLGVLQLNTFFDGLIASYPKVVGPTILGIDYPLQEGAMSAVSFAQRLYQFPLGVFGIAVATAIFPALARLADADDDRAAFTDTVRRGLRLVVFIGVPAAVGLVLVREPLAAVVLQGGDFTAGDTARVSRVLLGYAPAIWAYSMVHVLTRAFYARDDALTPVRVAVGVVALNLVLNCTLIWWLREAGLAWSTAACSIVQVAVLLVLLQRRVGAIVDRGVRASWLRSVVATAVMTGVLLLVAIALPDRDPGTDGTWLAAAGRLLALVAVGGLVFVTAALTLRMPELRWVIARR